MLAKILNITRIEADNNGETSLVVYANSFQKLQEELHDLGARVLYKFPFIGAYGITLKIHRLEELACLSEVHSIVCQTKVYCMLNHAKPQVLQHEQEFTTSMSGKGIGIAFIDTGLYPHLDFFMPRVRVSAFVDFIGNHKQCYDDNGHGTFVTSVACGNGLTSGNLLSGFAPQASIIALKAMDKSGEAGAFKILQAMQWIYDNHKKYNIKVVCMSFGSEPLQHGDPLAMGAEILWDEGLTIVTAAGNSGPDSGTIKSPAISPKVITVGGASKQEGVQCPAQFSSRGPTCDGYFKPDIIAPSVGICACSHQGNYCIMSGTSVAAPMVAGMCALILQEHDFSNNKIKELLLQNANPLQNDKNSVGYGFVQMPKY